MKWSPYQVLSIAQQVLLSASFNFILLKKICIILHPYHLLYCPRLPGNEYHVTTPHLQLDIIILKEKKPQASLEMLRQVSTVCCATLTSVILRGMGLLSLKTFSSWRLWCLALSRNGEFTSSQDILTGWSAEPSLNNWRKSRLLWCKHLDCKDKSLPAHIRNGKSLQSGGMPSAVENDPASEQCATTLHTAVIQNVLVCPHPWQVFNHSIADATFTIEGIISTPFLRLAVFQRYCWARSSPWHFRARQLDLPLD